MNTKQKKLIDKEVAKFPLDQPQSAVMAALAIMQTEKNWLSEQDIAEVAQYLGMPEIAVLEVATFYNMYDLKPVGKYKISVCTNISCMLRNSDEIVDHLKKKLNIEFNEITKDGKFYLKESECMGACGGAPLISINNKSMYENLTVEKIDQIIDKLK
ncbi:MAG: NADH-quinone oxidoreductase subunit NuoE [Nitrosomonadales bacterium]|jgi:NADH-quinone oxidoreductase subunit E